MKLIGNFITHIFSNAVAILAASYFIAGFSFRAEDFIGLMEAAFILTVLNMFLRPFVKFFLGPFVLLTFGLLIIVINAGMLYLLDFLSDPLTIQGILPLILGTFVIGAVNAVIGIGERMKYKK